MASGYTSLKQRFISEIQTELQKKPVPAPEITTENAIAPLPEPLQKYLRFCGFVGKPAFQNARLKVEGCLITERPGPGLDEN